VRSRSFGVLRLGVALVVYLALTCLRSPSPSRRSLGSLSGTDLLARCACGACGQAQASSSQIFIV
jgi:hypothetical protein